MNKIVENNNSKCHFLFFRDGPYFPVKPDKLEGPEDGQAINPLRDPYSGYLAARPAILNTGYTVSEGLSSSANWPTNSTTTEFSPAVIEAPIRFVTFLTKCTTISTDHDFLKLRQTGIK